MLTRLGVFFGKLLVLALCVAAFSGTGIVATLSTAASPGDILRGESFSTLYYYAADGMRYVFPNEKTYFSWYSGFSNVRSITDVELGQIQIGGNVTYRPGTKMLKINTDPKTYAVEQGGTLRWIESEGVASALYGGDWMQKIDDLPDAFFANYHVGASIRHPDDYILRDVLAETSSVGDDKGIVTPQVISITGTGFGPIDVTVEVGQSVRYVNNDSVQHTVTADDLLWGSGTLAPGAEFVHTFQSEGTFPFFDSYNSRNTGAVYVMPSNR